MWHGAKLWKSPGKGGNVALTSSFWSLPGPLHNPTNGRKRILCLWFNTFLFSSLKKKRERDYLPPCRKQYALLYQIITSRVACPPRVVVGRGHSGWLICLHLSGWNYFWEAEKWSIWSRVLEIKQKIKFVLICCVFKISTRCLYLSNLVSNTMAKREETCTSDSQMKEYLWIP